MLLKCVFSVFLFLRPAIYNSLRHTQKRKLTKTPSLSLAWNQIFQKTKNNSSFKSSGVTGQNAHMTKKKLTRAKTLTNKSPLGQNLIQAKLTWIKAYTDKSPHRQKLTWTKAHEYKSRQKENFIQILPLRKAFCEFLSMWAFVPLGFCLLWAFVFLGFVFFDFCLFGLLSFWAFVFSGFCLFGL